MKWSTTKCYTRSTYISMLNLRKMYTHQSFCTFSGRTRKSER